MHLFAASLLTLLPAIAAQSVAPQTADATNAAALTSAKCPLDTRHFAYSRGEALKPHKLGELPSGNMYIAVYRHDSNGCETPIVVKYGVGRR